MRDGLPVFGLGLPLIVFGQTSLLTFDGLPISRPGLLRWQTAGSLSCAVVSARAWRAVALGIGTPAASATA
jgi:hypothetical protein